MAEWDAAAIAKEKGRANWYAFCDRNGWDYKDPYNHRHWDKRQFREALRHMPKDHPDRWKYRAGAWYAGSPGVLLFLGVLGSVLLGYLSVVCSIILGAAWLVWVVPPVVAAVWAWWHARRYTVLSS